MAKNKYTCYLDLDGVLVDFIKGALKYHDRFIPYEHLDWDFDKRLGLTPEQFWEPLDYNFWLGLEWTKEGKEILATVEKYFGDQIAIITSPPKTSGAVQGKLDWVAREMPKYSRKTFVGARKELLASPYKILIDDRKKNFDDFLEAGGCAFLISRPWNRSTLDSSSELSIVQDLDQCLKGLLK